MKKKMTTALLILLATFGFAQEAELAQNSEILAQNLAPVEVKVSPITIQEKISFKNKSFGYVRLGVADSELPKPSDISLVPGLGLGYRFDLGSSAVDLSASANWRQYSVADGKESSYNYTLPKANAIYYVSSAKNNSLYVAGGLALSAIKERTKTDPFIGFVPNAAVGFEMHRHESWRSFVQLDVSKPIFAVNKAIAEQTTLHKTFAELSVGAGF